MKPGGTSCRSNAIWFSASLATAVAGAAFGVGYLVGDHGTPEYNAVGSIPMHALASNNPGKASIHKLINTYRPTKEERDLEEKADKTPMEKQRHENLFRGIHRPSGFLTAEAVAP